MTNRSKGGRPITHEGGEAPALDVLDVGALASKAEEAPRGGRYQDVGSRRFERPELILERPASLCSVCNVAVDRCAFCGLGILRDQKVRCYRADGHDHETCAEERHSRTPVSPRRSTVFPRRS